MEGKDARGERIAHGTLLILKIKRRHFALVVLVSGSDGLYG